MKYEKEIQKIINYILQEELPNGLFLKVNQDRALCNEMFRVIDSGEIDELIPLGTDVDVKGDIIGLWG